MEAAEGVSLDLICITRFPEFGFELKHSVPCEMRAGRLHGSAVIQAASIRIDFEDARATDMEVEYLLGDESVEKILVPIRFPSDLVEEVEYTSAGQKVIR
jgi:hypothetical protein